MHPGAFSIPTTPSALSRGCKEWPGHSDSTLPIKDQDLSSRYPGNGASLGSTRTLASCYSSPVPIQFGLSDQTPELVLLPLSSHDFLNHPLISKKCLPSSFLPPHHPRRQPHSTSSLAGSYHLCSTAQAPGKSPGWDAQETRPQTAPLWDTDLRSCGRRETRAHVKGSSDPAFPCFLSS